MPRFTSQHFARLGVLVATVFEMLVSNCSGPADGFPEGSRNTPGGQGEGTKYEAFCILN